MLIKPILHLRIVSLQVVRKKEKPKSDKSWTTADGTQSYHMTSKCNDQQGALKCSDLIFSFPVCICDHQGPCFLGESTGMNQTCYLLHKTKKHKTSDLRRVNPLYKYLIPCGVFDISTLTLLIFSLLDLVALQHSLLKIIIN